jgi:hypothetical protein
METTGGFLFREKMGSFAKVVTGFGGNCGKRGSFAEKGGFWAGFFAKGGVGRGWIRKFFGGRVVGMSDVGELPVRGSLSRRIEGSMLSAVIGGCVLDAEVAVLIFAQMHYAPFDSQLHEVSLMVSGAGVLVALIWLVALAPLYLLVPQDSWLWKWPICTMCGVVLGAMIMYAIEWKMGLGNVLWFDDLLCSMAGVAGGATCLFGSLTRGRFHRDGGGDE